MQLHLYCAIRHGRSDAVQGVPKRPDTFKNLIEIKHDNENN